MPATRNKYFVCLHRDRDPVPWEPANPESKVNIHSEFWGKAFVEMERRLDLQGMTFYQTWDVGDLPSYGDDVVAVVMGDEWCRTPLYARRVGAIFKCYGTRPDLNGRGGAAYLNFLTRTNQAKIYAIGTPYRLMGGRGENIFDVPLGYANQVDLPLKPMSDRVHDLSFAGSVVHRPYPAWSPKKWLQTPKSLSRRWMIAELLRLRDARADWRVDVKTTESYRMIRTADPMEYSERMMDTRIALVPRGTNPETFRYFEAMRAGCVVVAEALPSRWFYDDGPHITVGDWSELESRVEPLLGDEEALAEAGILSRAWWDNRCSEIAVGHYMADRLASLKG